MPLTHLFHTWQTVRDTGRTVYEACATCHRRQAWYRQPGEETDMQWLSGGPFRASTPAHRPDLVRDEPSPEPIEAFQSQRRDRR